MSHLIFFVVLSALIISFHPTGQKFDTLKGHRAVIESISVGVLDNLLCVFSKSEETTIFIDVAALFSDDQRVFRDGIELFEPAGDAAINVHSKTLSFLRMVKATCTKWRFPCLLLFRTCLQLNALSLIFCDGGCQGPSS